MTHERKETKGMAKALKVDEWHGAYKDSWQQLIVPEAFCHP